MIHKIKQRWIQQHKYWVYDGRIGSGVNRFVCLLVYPLYILSFSWLRPEQLIHSGKQQIQEAITSPLQLCVGVHVIR